MIIPKMSLETRNEEMLGRKRVMKPSKYVATAVMRRRGLRPYLSAKVGMNEERPIPMVIMV